LNRGSGRINILPPLRVPRHQRVAKVVVRIFATKDFDSQK
jgi:hypothetical protein